MSLAEVKLGLQSYSLRRLSFEDALREVANLGLKFVEAYPEHLPPSVAEVGRARELCDRYGVRIVAHGVNHMPRDEGKLRELFEFARQLGLEVLTADPDPDSFDLLDEMVEEYDPEIEAILANPESPTYIQALELKNILLKYAK